MLNALAVTVAMYCLIQFYVQLKEPLAEQKLFIKIVAIKLVVFLSFWQASAISVGTSTLKIVHPNEVVAYPDLKVGIPALLLCVEMAAFAVLHLWAFPYSPYTAGAPRTFYPVPDADKGSPSIENARSAPSGGFMGMLAIFDALNLWDFIKAFGRGMRWLFCGVKRRKEDASYQLSHGDSLDMDNLPENKEGGSSYDRLRPGVVAPGNRYDDYRPPMQGYGHPAQQQPSLHSTRVVGVEERAGLMDNAQPNPEIHGYSGAPPRPRRDPSPYDDHYQANQSQLYQAPGNSQPIGVAQGHYDPYDQPSNRQPRPTEAQAHIGQALWGQGSGQRPA